jgi:DNA-binding CsgD family transcriptional regulator
MRVGWSDPMSVVLASAEATTLDELARGVADRVAEMVDGWGGLLYRYEGGRIVPIGGALCDSIVDYRPELVPTDPTQIRARSLAPQPRVVLASRAVGRRAFERSAAYTDYYRRHDLERITCLWLTDRPYATEGMVGMLLARHRKRDEFDVQDGERLGAVLSALAVAVRRCERADALGAIATVIGAYVVLDPHPLWMSPAAHGLLGGRVPDELEVAARRLLAADKSARVEVELRDARAELQVAGPLGRPVVIARLESRTVRDCTAARLRERFGLTAAEMRVLRLVALGLTNATIADRCDVSVETVRTHVARVLAKLDVGTRAQAAALVWSYETDG